MQQLLSLSNVAINMEEISAPCKSTKEQRACLSLIAFRVLCLTSTMSVCQHGKQACRYTKYGMSEISIIPMKMTNFLLPHKRGWNSTMFQFYGEFLEFNKSIGVFQISYSKIHSCAAEQNWCKARPSFCTHLRHHGSLRTFSHRVLEKYCLSPSLC